MQTIYLHIGFHKTGTSAIQQFLFANDAALRARGYLLPVAGRAGESHAFLANGLKNANAHIPTDRLYADLAGELTESGCHSAILSSECFLEEIPPARLVARLAPLGAVKVVVYLRRQDHWLQSLYNEVIRDASRRFTGGILSMREVRRGTADYSAVLAKWEATFGAENIIVRVYEREQMPGGLLPDFMRAVSLGMEGFVEPSACQGCNAGLPESLVIALRSLNQIAMVRPLYRKLVDALEDMAPEIRERTGARGYSFVSLAERRELLVRFDAGNARIARELLGREDGRLFYEEPPAGDDDSKAGHMIPVELQHEIFERLPQEVREHFERLLPRFRNRKSAHPLFPSFQPEEEERLQTLNQRMRLELNWVYERLDMLTAELAAAREQSVRLEEGSVAAANAAPEGGTVQD